MHHDPSSDLAAIVKLCIGTELLFVDCATRESLVKTLVDVLDNHRTMQKNHSFFCEKFTLLRV